MSRLNCTILLSYPRCGNSWLRFCIEAISEQPSYPDSEYIKSLRNIVEVKGNYILRKEHSLDDPLNLDKVSVIDSPMYKNLKLILLLRNYKECIIRQGNDYNDAILGKHKGKYNYMGNIHQFDLWTKEKRLLIYYEDLLTHPEKELRKIVAFMGLDENKLNSFMEKYEYYRDSSIQAYHTLQDPSASKGKDLLYHSRQRPKERMKEWDERIKESHPDMFEKYLKRYAEGE